MADYLDKILNGTMCFLWEGPIDIEKIDSASGWISRKRATLTIETLVEDKIKMSTENTMDSPDCMLALTPHGTALLLATSIIGSRLSTGQKAATRTYRAGAIVSNVPGERLIDDRIISLTANFPGIGRWAGMSASKPSQITNKEGRLVSFSTTVSSEDEYSVRLQRGKTLTIGTTWKVSGPRDCQTIYAPIRITCTNPKATEFSELLLPLLKVQDLLNIAYGGFIVADRATVKPNLLPDETPSHYSGSEFWNGSLMEIAGSNPAPKSMNEVPFFNISHIGGINGVARWIKLATNHPRATRPIASQFRHGFSLAEVTLMDVASGIEYWVKSNKDTAWSKSAKRTAKDGRRGVNHAAALTKKIGQTLDKWCGDAEAWAEDFNETYNKLKHAPNYNPDSNHVVDLAMSGRYILTAALLDRAANSKKPSASIFASHRIASLGARLKEMYATRQQVHTFN